MWFNLKCCIHVSGSKLNYFVVFFKVGNDKGQAVLQIEASELPVNNEDLSKVKKLAKTTHI